MGRLILGKHGLGGKHFQQTPQPPLQGDIKSAYVTIIKVGMKLLKIRNPKVQALIVLPLINRN